MVLPMYVHRNPQSGPVQRVDGSVGMERPQLLSSLKRFVRQFVYEDHCLWQAGTIRAESCEEDAAPLGITRIG